MHRHARLEGSGGMLTHKVLKKDVVLRLLLFGTEVEHSDYMVHRVLYPVFSYISSMYGHLINKPFAFFLRKGS